MSIPADQLAKLQQSAAAARAKIQATYAANQKPASTPMSAQTPTTTGSMPSSPSYSTPSTPSYSTPSYSPPSSSSNPITMSRVVDGKEITFNVTGDRGREIWEGQGATVVNSAPNYTYYTPPTNYGVDSQGKPLTEQQWLGGGGLLGLSGKNEVNTAKLSNGSYLDTTNMTPQQIQAATLWDEVQAGKRSADSVAQILKGQGIDAYGNPVSGLYTGNNVYYASGYNPSAPMSAQSAKTAGPSPTGSANIGSIPKAGTTESAQAWINNPSSGFGGMDQYVATQQQRYNQAIATGDQDLIRRLQEDMQRVGYTLQTPETRTGGPVPSPTQTNVIQQPDYRAIAEAEAARELADRNRIAGQQITGITNAFNRSNQILQGNRTLEDVSINNTLNPFSGRTAFAKGLVGRERTLADESAQGNFNTAIQGIQQGLADDQNTAAQWIMARASELENQAQQRAMQEAQLTGIYNGSPTMAARQQALDQAQREWENRFAYGQATGTFNNGQKTLAAVQQEWENMFREQQFEESKAARLWEQAFNEKSFTQKMKEAAADRGLQWANLSQRDKEFIADQEFREKQFQLDQDKFNASQSGSQLTAKDSTDNYNMIFDDLQSDGVDKNTARQLLQANRAFLTDSDYNKLNSWINDNL